MLSKSDTKELSVSSSILPTLLAWCSEISNKISVIDLETKQSYVTFDGARNDINHSRTQVKEIPNTKLLVSLHHDLMKSANMEIFDISKRGKANKIYSFQEDLKVVGFGDVAYNSRRNILGAIPITTRITYHLFNVNAYASNPKEVVKLNRKSKWHSQHGNNIDSDITDFDFNPAGDSIVTTDLRGVCLISNVDTNNYVFHLRLGNQGDRYGRCRWSTNTGKPLLFVEYDRDILNIFDVEKNP